MKINNPNELSSYLRAKRSKARRSQADVAEKVGIQQQTISSFERNSTQARVDTLFKIINELDLELHLEFKHSAPSKTKGWQEEW